MPSEFGTVEAERIKLSENPSRAANRKKDIIFVK